MTKPGLPVKVRIVSRPFYFNIFMSNRQSFIIKDYLLLLYDIIHCVTAIYVYCYLKVPVDQKEELFLKLF